MFDDSEIFFISYYLELLWHNAKYKINRDLICYSSVAQLVEQLTVNQLVAGSSPARGANKLVAPLKATNKID